MAASSYIHLFFYRNISGNEPGPKEAAITERQQRGNTQERSISLVKKKHKGWVTAPAWGVFEFPPPTHSCIKYGSTIFLSNDSQNPYFPPPEEHFLGNSDQEYILDDGATETAERKITF